MKNKELKRLLGTQKLMGKKNGLYIFSPSVNPRLDTAYNIYHSLKREKAKGFIIPDIVFDVLRNRISFELENEFNEQYHGLDDEMPDAFNAWLGERIDDDPVLQTILD